MNAVRALAFASLVLALAPLTPAAEWHQGLYLDGGGEWRSRLEVRIHNDQDRILAGEPVALEIGGGAGQLPLVGQPAQAVRVCNAQGVELLFALYASDGTPLDKNPLPESSTLVIPVDCPAKGRAAFFIYFDNPQALAVPDFLSVHTRVVNGDVEQGQGATPAGWQHDAADAEHLASWSTEQPHAGRRCLKTVVAAGAQATWISTRQRDLHITRGAKYRLQAWVKGQDIRGRAGWYIHVGNREQPLMISPMLLAGEGTFDWQQVSAEFTAPATADLADLGTVLYGTGTAWFDSVSLECLTPGILRTEIQACDFRLAVAEESVAPSVLQAEAEAAVGRTGRFQLDVRGLPAHLADPPQVAVNFRQLETRLRGRLQRASVLVTQAGRPVGHQVLGDQLLFRPLGTPPWPKQFRLHFSDDPQFSEAAVKMRTPAGAAVENLVQNPGFELGTNTPEDWVSSGAEKTGVTLGVDQPGRTGSGQRCGKLHVPPNAPKAWRGWRQDVPVQPNRTYLCAAWIKCQDVRDGEVRVHLHRRTADGQLSASEPFGSLGPGVSGNSDWTLVTGQVTTPPDTRILQLHLTMESSGTIWHDDISVTEIVPARLGRLEGREERELQVWQVPAVVKVFRDDCPPSRRGPVEIAAAKNEQEPLQLAVRGPGGHERVQVTVEPPVGPNGCRLPAPTVNVVGFVPIDYPTNYYESQSPAWHRKVPTSRGECDGWAGLWPDPLLPDNSFQLAPGQTQPLWITVSIPKTAPAGDYAGQVRLSAGSTAVAQIPFTVHVWDFTLPDESHVLAKYDVRFGDDGGLWGRSLDDMYPEITRFLAARRLCPDSIRPDPVFRRENGRITADFTAFDKAAAVYFDELKFPNAYTPWELYLFGWGHPPKPIFGEQPYPGSPPFTSADRSQLRPEYKRVYQDMLRLYWKHLQEKGWDKRVTLYISDEPFDHEPHIRTQMKALCDMVHEVDRAIPIYASTWKHIPEWDGYLDIWGVGHDGRVPPEKLAGIRRGGARLWFTTDGQMCTDTPYCAVERLLPHYCFQHGVEGYEFWGVAWQTYDPFRFGWHRYIHQESAPGKSSWIRYPNGDGFLIYPGAALGRPGVISSIRCEQAREGVEDFEYLHLLRQRIAGAAAAGRKVAEAEQALATARQLVPIPNAGGRYSTRILPDPEAVYRVRRQVAAAIEALRP